MEPDKGPNLALKLAVEVLNREMSFDDGVIRAQASNMLESFIEGLNVLVGSNLFDLSEAQQWLRSGSAERAMTGDGPPFEMPPQLKNWTLDSDKIKPPLDEKDFTTWEIQVLNYLSELEEIRSRLNLVEKTMNQVETIASPWIAPAVILVITLGTAMVAQFGFRSTVGGGLALGVGSLLCLSIFQKEMSRFEVENRRIRIEMQRRSETRTKCLKEFQDCTNRIRVLRTKAQELVESREPLPEEEIPAFREKFSALFPEN